MTTPTEPMHGSLFSHGGTGCLLIGPSGTGKSRLVADAMMMGGRLVADDRVALLEMMGLVAGSPVPQLQGILELRHLGLLKINDILTKHVIHLIVELDPNADLNVRIPEPQFMEFFGIKIPHLRVPPVPYTTAASLLIYMKAMQEKRVLPPDWMPQAG